MLHSTRGQGLLAVTAGLATGATQALALDATSVLVQTVGPLHLKPHFSVAERYDDNIFYRASGDASRPVEDDFITVVSPGLNLQLGRQEANYILLDYQFDQLFYLQHDEQNSADHRLLLNSKLGWKRAVLEGTDRVQVLSGILGGSAAYLDQQVDRITYFDNYRLQYALSEKTGIYVDGQFDAADYERGTPLYDSNTLRGTGGFAFQATPKTTFFGEVYYGQSANDTNIPLDTNNLVSIKPPHSDFVGGFVGARGQFTPRLTGVVKAGYESREYSDGTPAPSSPVVEISLQQRIGEKTSATLSYVRQNSVSIQPAFGANAASAYTADRVSLQVTQILSSNGKLVGILNGSFENDDYKRIGSFTRQDVWYRVNAGLNYNIQLWLTAGLTYEFESYRSNQVIDYDANRVIIRISVGY